MAGSTGLKELNLVLIGKTGVGKSATGNTILGHRMFTESCKTTSVTKDVVSKFTRFDNFLVKVVDCPGLMDTDMDSGEDKKAAVLNMDTALGMCNGGVDAFILVIRPDRFMEDQIKLLDTLKTILGDRYMQNVIVVVTRGDWLKDDMEHEGCGDMSFKEWCSLDSEICKTLFDDFSDRFLLINNREKDPQKNETQRREIIQLADNLRNLNGRYASQNFEEAKAARDKLIIHENMPMLNESLQMKVSLLAADLFKLKKAPSYKERESILQSLDALKQEIIENDTGTGLLNRLLVKVEQVEIALHDVDELHRLAERMVNIREETSSFSRYGKVTAGSNVGAGIGQQIAAFAVATSPLCIGLAAAGLLPGTLGLTKLFKSSQEHQDLNESEKPIQTEKRYPTGHQKVTRFSHKIERNTNLD